MSDRLEAVILARDQASKVFEKVGDSAEKMGDDITASAKESGRSLRELQDDAKNVALGVGVMIGSFALAGQSARDHEIAVNTLRRTYGDASNDMLEFAEQMQDTTNFSNDAVIAASNIAATLARNYAFTADEIQQVLQISADLAATTGIGLEDATMRVTAALRGEAESAEWLGLTLNQAAIDVDNLTLSMSNQEAGHYRFNELIDQSAFAQGAAAEQADSMYGAMMNIEHGINDAAQAVAGFSPELAGMGAYLAENAVQVTALTLGVGAMANAAKAANSVASSFGLSLGPAGLVAAAGLAVGGMVVLANYLKDDFVSAEQEANQATASLISQITELGEAGELTGSRLILAQEIKDITDALNAVDAGALNHIADTLEILQTNMSLDEDLDFGSGLFQDLSQSQIELIDTNGDLLISLEEVDARIELLRAQSRAAAEDNKFWSEVNDEVAAALAAEGEGAAELQQNMAGLLQAYQDGHLERDIAIAGAENLIANYNEEAAAAQIAAAAEAEHGEAMRGVGRGYAEAALTADDYLAIAQEIASTRRNGEIEHQVNLIAQLKGEFAGLAMTLNTMDAGGGRGVFDAIASSAHGAGSAAMGASGEMISFIAEAGNEYMRLYNGIASTGEALGNAFRVIVSNTDAMANQTQGVEDWLVGLSDVRDVYGELTVVQEANARVQQSVLDIQAGLAPVVADATVAQADYIDSITELEGHQQLAALGFMDTSMAARAMELQMYAMSGASEEAIASIIEGSAVADPVLAAMLEKMGLITIGADGTITVNVEGQGGVDALIDSLDQLTLVTYMATADVDAEQAKAELTALFGQSDAWDNTIATAGLFVDDHASGQISNAMQMLNAFNGSSATGYINVVQTGGVDRIAGAQGGVMAYAHGGVTALMGEWGNETLHFPNGTKGRTNGPGLYGVPEGTYVTPASATSQTSGAPIVNLTVNIGGSVVGMDDVAEEVSREIVPAIQRAMAAHERGF
jgi:hypothetical protein